MRKCIAAFLILFGSSVGFSEDAAKPAASAIPDAVVKFASSILAGKGSSIGTGTLIAVSGSGGHSFGVILTAAHVVGPPRLKSNRGIEQTSISFAPDGALAEFAFFVAKVTNDAPKFTSTTLYRPPLTLMNKMDVTSIVPEADFALNLVNLDTTKDQLSFMQDLKVSDLGKFDMRVELGSSDRPNLKVYALGFPGANQYKATLTTGVILSDEDAEARIQKSMEALPLIPPFKRDVEFMVSGPFSSGFSGGPALDADGKLIGVVVRAGTSQGEPYARIVRIEYILSKLRNASFESTIKELFKPVLRAAPARNSCGKFIAG